MSNLRALYTLADLTQSHDINMYSIAICSLSQVPAQLCMIGMQCLWNYTNDTQVGNTNRFLMHKSVSYCIVCSFDPLCSLEVLFMHRSNPIGLE